MSKELHISSFHNVNKAIELLSEMPSVLHLESGIYEQDLILRENIVIEGSGLADLEFTVVKGTHRFPKKGKLGFKNIKFSHESDIFTALEDSDISVLFYSCAFEVKKGYPLKLPKVKGNITFFDGWLFGEENGFVDNTEGDINFKFFNLTSESNKNSLPMILNASSIFFNVHITHDIELKGKNKKYDIEGGSWIEGSIIRD